MLHDRCRIVFTLLSVLVMSLGVFTTAVSAAPQEKVTICHYPPGNLSNAHDITVGASAVPAHLAHGDFGGPCAEDCRLFPSICDDEDACTSDTCNSDGTCTHGTVSCDDGNACTTDDACDPATGCTHGTVSCDDENVCTTDSCTPETGCENVPVNCDDSSSCTTDSCNPATGACENTPTADSITLHEHCDPGSAVFQIVCGPGKQAVLDRSSEGFDLISYITLGAAVTSVTLTECGTDNTFVITENTDLCSEEPFWNDRVCFVEIAACQTFTGTGCYWLSNITNCWEPSPFGFPGTVEECQSLDSCNPGGGGASGGGCYKWADNSNSQTYPPWP